MSQTFIRTTSLFLTIMGLMHLLASDASAAVPKAPSALVATAASSSQINLIWVDASTDETGFELEQSVDGIKFVSIADLPANTIAYQDKALTSATKYWYRIRSKNASGTSAYSALASATTLVAITIPKAPSALTATAVSSSQINLTWTDNATDETGFEVERSADGLSYTKIADLGPDASGFQNTGLVPATRYWYRVLAKNTAGKSAYSNVANATTQQVVPIAPSFLVATAVSTTQIELTWTDNAGNETGFQVERSLNGNVFTKIADLAANATSYQSTGLLPATLYYFRVRAVNAVGTSAYSNVTSAQTDNIPVPDAPINFTAVPTAPDLIQLRWAKPTGDASEVVIERSKADQPFVEIAKLAATILQYEDRSKLEAADYRYRIKARNAGGDSPYSLLAIVRAASIITATEPEDKGVSAYVSGRTLIVEAITSAMARISVYDMRGRMQKAAVMRQTARVELSALPAGMYLVVTDTGREVISKRILLY